MATTREAGVRLSLNPSGFKRAMSDALNFTKAKASEVGAALKSALDRAAKGGIDGFKTMGSTIKSGLGLAKGMLGGLGVEQFLQGALQSEAAFRKLAFAVRSATGKEFAGGSRALQQQLQELAVGTGNSTEEIATAFDSLLTKSSDLDFTTKAMKSIATTATATGMSMNDLVELVDATNAAFGVTADKVPDTLALMASLSRKTGLSVDDFKQKFELVGLAAKQAGLAGEEGLRMTAALMAQADASAGKKGLPALMKMIDELGSKANTIDIFKKLKFDTKGVKDDALGNITELIKQSGGDKAKLEEVFKGPQLKILADMGATYAETFEKTGGDIRTKTAAAVGALEESLRKLGQGTLSAADVQKEFASQMETNERKIAVAVEQMKVAFTKPEIAEAITRFASVLPQLVDMVTWAVEHPILALGGATVGKGAAGALIGPIIDAALGRGGKAAGASMEAAMKSGGSDAAERMAKALEKIAGIEPPKPPAGGGGVPGSPGGGIPPIVPIAAAAVAATTLSGDFNSEEKSEEMKAKAADYERRLAQAQNEGRIFARDDSGNAITSRNTGSLNYTEDTYKDTPVQAAIRFAKRNVAIAESQAAMAPTAAEPAAKKPDMTPARGALPQPPRIQEVRVVNPKEIGAEGSMLRPVKPGAS